MKKPKAQKKKPDGKINERQESLLEKENPYLDNLISIIAKIHVENVFKELRERKLKKNNNINQ